MAFTSLRIARAAPRMRFVQMQRMRFSAVGTRFAGKESALHNEGRAEEAEKHKQEQLGKVKQGTNEWKEELASDSEDAIKADRAEKETGHGEEDIKKLQEETKHVAEKKHG